MKKMIALFIALALLMPVAAGTVLAATDQGEPGVAPVGNKLCPISGKPVSGGDFVDHQGKRYGLCCPMCKMTFLSDPEKYIEKMNQQEAAASSGETPADDGAMDMEMDMGEMSH